MKIKNLLAIAAVAILTVSTTKAEDSSGWNKYMCYSDDSSALYNPGLSLDLFGAYIKAEDKFSGLFENSQRDGDWGGGVGLSYFFNCYFGLGADASAFANGGALIDVTSANIILRWPSRLSPYVFAGGGYYFGPDSWLADAGVGLELRFNRFMGIFSDVRYNWSARENAPDIGLARAGLRFSF